MEAQQEIKASAETKRKAYLSGNKTEYRKARNETKKEMRRLLNNWWRKKSEEVQEAANNNDARGMYDGLKTLGAVYDKKISNPSLKSRDGTETLRTKEERKSRWKQHHNEQLNVISSAEQHLVDNLEQLPTQTVLDDMLTKGEVRRALRQMRKNRAPGVDGIEVEVLRSLDGELFQQPFVRLQNAWVKEVPQEFKDAFIINLPKKLKGERSYSVAIIGGE